MYDCHLNYKVLICVTVRRDWEVYNVRNLTQLTEVYISARYVANTVVSDQTQFPLSTDFVLYKLTIYFNGEIDSSVSYCSYVRK